MPKSYGRALLIGLASILILSWVSLSSSADEISNVSAETCSIYRTGAIEHRRMPVYYGFPSADPSSFYWIDIWINPEYENTSGLAGLPRPDGLPDSSLLLDIDIADGRSLTREYRVKTNVFKKTYFSMLLSSGMNHLPLARILRAFANFPPELGRDEIPKIVRTGEFVSGMERIDIPSYKPSKSETGPRYDWYAEFDKADQVTALMQCRLPGSVPNPGCQLYEKIPYFEAKISQFRRNQLDQLGLIRKHARNFVTCLTWKGE
jgi:hypothetical protein